MENSNNKPVIYRRRLAKGKCNPSVYKPILENNSSTKEITTDNDKLPQPITEPNGIY